jgi:hypothetical protein
MVCGILLLKTCPAGSFGVAGTYPKIRSSLLPLHVAHLEQQCPEVLTFLGLPAGYRFLLAGDHVDVWFHPKLLAV